MRLWLERFNTLGLDRLIYRPRPGRPRLLDSETVRSEILPVVDDPSLAGQLHWAAVQLNGWLRQKKAIDYSYRPPLRYPQENHYARRILRPVPDKYIWHQQFQACATGLFSLLASRLSLGPRLFRPASRGTLPKVSQGHLLPS